MVNDTTLTTYLNSSSITEKIFIPPFYHITVSTHAIFWFSVYGFHLECRCTILAIDINTNVWEKLFSILEHQLVWNKAKFTVTLSNMGRPGFEVSITFISKSMSSLHFLLQMYSKLRFQSRKHSVNTCQFINFLFFPIWTLQLTSSCAVFNVRKHLFGL